MIKITKGLAKKMYDNGKEIMIIPNRLRPDSVLAFWTTKADAGDIEDFEKLCNAIFYYNCTPETGMKLAFYAKEV